MEKADTGLVIHTILVGPNPKDCMRWEIGQIANRKKELVVSGIAFDMAHWLEFKETSYNVYVRSADGKSKGDMLWRKYNNMPVSILYDI